MKAAFLVSMRGPDEWKDLFDFSAYDWGPFDTRVYTARDKLIAAGLLASEPNKRYGAYRLTEEGERRVEKLTAELGDDAESVRAFGAWVSERSFQSLIQSIYAEYPDYAKHSIFVH